MEEFGTKIEKLPFDNLKEIKEIHRHDGPLLVQYCDENNNDVLFAWVNCDENYHRWLVVNVAHNMLTAYLNNKIPYYELLTSNKDDIFYFLDIDDQFKRYNYRSSTLSEIPDGYLPSIDCLYHDDEEFL